MITYTARYISNYSVYFCCALVLHFALLLVFESAKEAIENKSNIYPKISNTVNIAFSERAFSELRI